MKTVLLLGPQTSSIKYIRSDLIDAILSKGHAVHVAGPGIDAAPETLEWLRARGVPAHDVPLSRTGVNPVSDLRFFLAFCRLLLRVRPDVVLVYSIKPIVWGGLAAWVLRVPGRFGLVTGLGYAFTGQATGKRAVIKKFAQALYSASLNRLTGVFFQNPDDRADLVTWGVLRGDRETVLVNGSGVNTDFFAPAPLPEGPPRFLLIARLLGDKGIREYAEAARAIHAAGIAAEFHLVGPLDPNPDGLRAQTVRA